MAAVQARPRSHVAELSDPPLALLGVDPSVIAQRLPRESDVSVRRALILSLGEYRDEQIAVEQRQPLVTKLLNDYQTDPDPGIHAAAEWTLGQWKQEKELAKIDGQLAGLQPGRIVSGMSRDKVIRWSWCRGQWSS